MACHHQGCPQWIIWVIYVFFFFLFLKQPGKHVTQRLFLVCAQQFSEIIKNYYVKGPFFIPFMFMSGQTNKHLLSPSTVTIGTARDQYSNLHSPHTCQKRNSSLVQHDVFLIGGKRFCFWWVWPTIMSQNNQRRAVSWYSIRWMLVLLEKRCLVINAAMPWFIITFSFLTTLALYGSYFSHDST